jgi:hypothetical protein
MDCEPRYGWWEALLAAHASGVAVVGGAIDAVPGQGFSARGMGDVRSKVDVR